MKSKHDVFASDVGLGVEGWGQNAIGARSTCGYYNEYDIYMALVFR